jgi:hypothetical protein
MSFNLNLDPSYNLSLNLHFNLPLKKLTHPPLGDFVSSGTKPIG